MQKLGLFGDAPGSAGHFGMDNKGRFGFKVFVPFDDGDAELLDGFHLRNQHAA